MKKDSVYIEHILISINHIEEYLFNKSYLDLVQSNLIQDAVIRNFQIIGEAAKKISETFKSENNTIPWKQMAGIRDKLVHEYTGVDLDAVWNTVKEDFPKIKKQLLVLKNNQLF
ncbi:MAG: DUF86 domain-containing protein [Bacteroidota bacterium]